MHRISVIVLAIAAASAPVRAQEHQHAAAAQFGTVKFANSCSAGVQPKFAEGMALLHSFEFGPAIDAFKAVAAQDEALRHCLLGHGAGAVGQSLRGRHQAGARSCSLAAISPRARRRLARRPSASVITSPPSRRSTTISRRSISARG